MATAPTALVAPWRSGATARARRDIQRSPYKVRVRYRQSDLVSARGGVVGSRYRSGRTKDNPDALAVKREAKEERVRTADHDIQPALLALDSRGHSDRRSYWFCSELAVRMTAKNRIMISAEGRWHVRRRVQDVHWQTQTAIGDPLTKNWDRQLSRSIVPGQSQCPAWPFRRHANTRCYAGNPPWEREIPRFAGVGSIGARHICKGSTIVVAPVRSVEDHCRHGPSSCPHARHR